MCFYFDTLQTVGVFVHRGFGCRSAGFKPVRGWWTGPETRNYRPISRFLYVRRRTAELPAETQHMLCFGAGLCCFFQRGFDILGFILKTWMNVNAKTLLMWDSVRSSVWRITNNPADSNSDVKKRLWTSWCPVLFVILHNNTDRIKQAEAYSESVK